MNKKILWSSLAFLLIFSNANIVFAADCSPLPCNPITATCGSANGQTFVSAPSNYLCGSGSTLLNWVWGDAIGPWDWDCYAGEIGGTDIIDCSAQTYNGSCSSLDGAYLVSKPTTNLCSVGTPSSVSGTGPWTWTCGSSPGTVDNCLANITGQCGSSDGKILTTPPTTYLEKCSYGVASSVTTSALNYTWNCSVVGGRTDYCSATRAVGQCGSASGYRFKSTDTGYVQAGKTQCALGNPTNTTFPSPGVTASWFCDNGGAMSSQCSATMNRKPVITNGSLNYSVPVFGKISFTGFYASDADGDTLTYAWGCDQGNFTNNLILNPEYNSLATPGIYTCNLLVNDGREVSYSSPVTVTVVNGIVGICGSANAHKFLSTDTGYVQAGKTQCALGNPTNTTFPSPGVTASWFCDNGGSISSQCSATMNRKPVITNGSLNYSVSVFGKISFTGFSASDADGDTLNYAWVCNNGGTFTNNTIANPEYIAPATARIDICTLIVSDAYDGTISSSVSVAVNSISKGRNYYYQELVPVSTVSGLLFIDTAILTFTPDDNSTYAIIASWDFANYYLGQSIIARLVRTSGTEKTFNEITYRSKYNYSEWREAGGMGVETFGVSPGPQTYKIQFRATESGWPAQVRNARIIAIKLVDGDVYAQEEIKTTTATTSFKDKTTLTFTPTSSGDYIVFAVADVDGTSTDYDFITQLTIDGTIYQYQNLEPARNTNKYFWGVMKKINLAGGSSHIIKIQHKVEHPYTTAGIANARIVAFKADEFINNYYGESEIRSTTNSTTPVNKLTLTHTPEAGEYLIFANAGTDIYTAAYSVNTNFTGSSFGTISGTEVVPSDFNTKGNTFWGMTKLDLSNVSTSWYIKYSTDINTVTAGIKDVRILALQLKSTTENSEPIIIDGTLTYSIVTGGKIFFTGFSASDADEDILTYTWTCNNGGTFTNNLIANPEYIAPATARTDTCTLLVSDTYGGVYSSPVTVTVINAISADNFKNPLEIANDLSSTEEECWYCDHYKNTSNEIVPAAGGAVGNIQFKFNYQGTTNLTGYQFAMSTGSNPDLAVIKSDDWVNYSVAPGGTVTVSTVKIGGINNNISVKLNASEPLAQIPYNSLPYNWWVKVKNSGGEESAWIPATGHSYTSKSHHYPVVKIALRSIVNDLLACTTVASSGLVFNIADPCYSTCGAANITNATDLENSTKWKCSICYDEITNTPKPCAITSATWELPTNLELKTGSTLSTANPTFAGVTSGQVIDNVRVTISGSSCPLEGGLDSYTPLPLWIEK